MAYTKMWEITERLDSSINYIVNEKKTENDEMKYVTCWNCNQVDPYSSMMQTKNLFHKTDTKRIGFHAIQSFEPGEGTPEIIHEIGVKLAEELFGDRYEFVVATHMDKDYLHNHIIINSTSFIDGKQFTNSKKDRHQMVEVSDRLCREYGLSIIEDPQLSLSRNKRPYKLRQFTDEIKRDMDECILHCMTPQGFVKNMELKGYEFKIEKGIDCIQHPNCKYLIPINALGRKYHLEDINNRILDFGTRNKMKFEKHQDLYQKYKSKQLKGILFIYVDWMVLLGILPDYKMNKSQKLSKEMRKELNHLDDISNEVILMAKFNIHTIDDLNDIKNKYKSELNQLLEARDSCYKERRKTKDLVQKEVISEEAKSYTPRIKELRKQIKLLEDLEKRTMRLEQQGQQIELKLQNKKVKEK